MSRADAIAVAGDEIGERIGLGKRAAAQVEPEPTPIEVNASAIIAEMARSRRPQLAWLDIGIPGMNGATRCGKTAGATSPAAHLVELCLPIKAQRSGITKWQRRARDYFSGLPRRTRCGGLCLERIVAIPPKRERTRVARLTVARDIQGLASPSTFRGPARLASARRLATPRRRMRSAYTNVCRLVILADDSPVTPGRLTALQLR